MSQTLSLPPGKYGLFITPPTPGVDFTGTPTPTVSYQWRKNGTAISGQTAATISGVWVEQSGGTVDLVDGDTISIDIILTNPVQATTKTVSAVIDASIPAPVITPISIRLVSAPNDPVSTIPNASIGSQIMVASAGSVSVVTTPPLLPTYQWRRGFAPIAGATSQTYTLQAADADSIIDCVVTATNSGGTATRTAAATVGTLPAAGWTELTPSADSRLIYVSNDGDDVAAASVKGRGYYLPSDPEIGDDPTNPVGAIVAYASPIEAAKRFRGRNWNGTTSATGIPDWTYNAAPDRNGYPDWILFRRGQTFNMPPVETYNGTAVKGITFLIGKWVGNRSEKPNTFSDYMGGASGRSESEPAVITAWGPPSESRPIMSPFGPEGNSRNMALVSIETPGDMAWEPSKGEWGASGWTGNSADNLLIEDCKARSFTAANTIEAVNMRFRRCVVSGTFNPSGHQMGFFTGRSGQTITIEECVFDRNGYKENPNDATTWTGSIVSGLSVGGMPAGTGVQPTRTYFDRNIYLSEWTEPVLRGNIFSRNGGGGSVQMRQGGICDRNLFIWNETALTTGSNEQPLAGAKSAIVKDNVILHDDCFLPPGGWGVGIDLQGPDDDTHVADGNVVTHFHRGTNGRGTISARGRAAGPLGPQSLLLRAILKDNDVYHQFGAKGIRVESPTNNNSTQYGVVGVLNADVTGNAVSSNGELVIQPDATKPATFDYSNNRFHAPSGSGVFTWGSTTGGFSGWQAAGYDADGTFTTDFAAFKASAGWTAPERDIVSYMESVDPTYAVNEDVYVDEDATIKQANRQKVWEVLASVTTGIASMTEAQAKLAARRYHAFVTFIQRAKENRKGAWDTRWTAEAVNNYIRAGFGKAAVTGAYDTRSLADRLLDYTT